MDLPQAVQTTLQETADFLSNTRDPWWILGSAAMALIGVDPGDIQDIDVLVSERDARSLMANYDLKNLADGGTERYRSNLFLTPNIGPVRVEVMSGYQIRTDGAWQSVAPVSRRAINIGSAVIFVPDREDQADLLKRLGRPKDLERLKRF